MFSNCLAYHIANLMPFVKKTKCNKINGHDEEVFMLEFLKIK